MRLRNLICLTLAIILFSFAGCSSVSESAEASETDSNSLQESDQSSETQDEPDEETEDSSINEENNKEEKGESEVKKTYSILFIGNSYTYYNNMPETIFKNLAKSAGYDVEIASITEGAYTLEKMADPNDTYGAQVERALTGTKKYDYVILQEQSARPATASVGDFYEAVRNLSARIQESGATPILYSTWGRKMGSSTLTKNGWTNESMTWKLAAAYEAIGKELNIPVAHVGLAFYDIYTASSTVELYNDDKSHPTYAGSYLAAATLFAEIFNEDLTEVNYTGSLSEGNALVLRQAAARAVFQTPSIPDEYKTASEGIGS